MKGKPMEALERAAQAHRAEIEKQQAALDAAVKEIEIEKRLCSEAVSNGDQAAFSKHRAAQADAESRRDFASARITFLQAEAPVKVEDARLTWQDIAAKYNKDLATAKSEYAKAKKKLCGLYLDMVELQNEMLKNREKLASLCGGQEDQAAQERRFPADVIPVIGGIDNRAGLRSPATRLLDPDANFVVSAAELEGSSSGKVYEKIFSIINLHRPA